MKRAPSVRRLITAVLGCIALGMLGVAPVSASTNSSLRPNIADCSACSVITYDPGQTWNCNVGYKSIADDSFDEGYEDCGVRVWWYENSDHSGYNHCMNSNHDWFPQLTYKSLYVSGNSAAC